MFTLQKHGYLLEERNRHTRELYGLLWRLSGKEPTCQCRRHGFNPFVGKIPWRRVKGMATHFSILAWRIPWTEEPGGLQSMGSQRVGHDLATKQQLHNRRFYTGVK